MEVRMPARILLSHVKALGFYFAQAVADHRQALADWANRPADWDPCPPPQPLHPLVATAVTVGTYEIVDDTPPPPAPPALEERQRVLVEVVRAALAAANAAVLPPLKRPLIELRTQAAASTKWEHRTLGDREALNNRKGIEARLQANELHAAHQLAAIADLTEQTIDGWTMEPFPEKASDAAVSLEARKEQLAAEIDAEHQRQVRALVHPLKRELMDLEFTQASAVPEEKRTKAQHRAIEDAAGLGRALGALQLHAAKLKAAIADLDEAGLAAWKPAPFPGA
jgi:ribosomal protein L29